LDANVSSPRALRGRGREPVGGQVDVALQRDRPQELKHPVPASGQSDICRFMEIDYDKSNQGHEEFC
jgi:hypothetical protein